MHIRRWEPDDKLIVKIINWRIKVKKISVLLAMFLTFCNFIFAKSNQNVDPEIEKLNRVLFQMTEDLSLIHI